jgi:hypothetical protein
MFDLLAKAAVVLSVIAAGVALVGGLFWLGLYIYFYRWLESLERP